MLNLKKYIYPNKLICQTGIDSQTSKADLWLLKVGETWEGRIHL